MDKTELQSSSHKRKMASKASFDAREPRNGPRLVRSSRWRLNDPNHLSRSSPPHCSHVMPTPRRSQLASSAVRAQRRRTDSAFQQRATPTSLEMTRVSHPGMTRGCQSQTTPEKRMTPVQAMTRAPLRTPEHSMTRASLRTRESRGWLDAAATNSLARQMQPRHLRCRLFLVQLDDNGELFALHVDDFSHGVFHSAPGGWLSVGDHDLHAEEHRGSFDIEIEESFSCNAPRFTESRRAEGRSLGHLRR